jgi:hypothetical protein
MQVPYRASRIEKAVDACVALPFEIRGVHCKTTLLRYVLV